MLFAKCLPTPSFSDRHSWIWHGRNPITFVSVLNDVLGMINYWDVVNILNGWLILKECANTITVAVRNNCGFFS